MSIEYDLQRSHGVAPTREILRLGHSKHRVAEPSPRAESLARGAGGSPWATQTPTSYRPPDTASCSPA